MIAIFDIDKRFRADVVAEPRPFLISRFRVCLLVGALTTSAARAETPDPFDFSQGAYVITASETLKGTGIAGIFGESTPGELGAGVTLFKDGGTNFVEFRTANAIELAGVELLVRSDDNSAGGPRSVDRFSFYADADGDGAYETTLVDRAWPVNDGSANNYSFSPVRAFAFKAEFTSGWPQEDDRKGPRVVEMNAILVPQPGRFLLPILGCTLFAGATVVGAILAFRRRKHFSARGNGVIS